MVEGETDIDVKLCTSVAKYCNDSADPDYKLEEDEEEDDDDERASNTGGDKNEL